MEQADSQIVSPVRQVQSPASTIALKANCSSCKEDKQTFIGKVCLACWVEKEISPKFNWSICPTCQVEWSKLLPPPAGVCWDCDKKSVQEREKNAAIKKALLKLFGSESKLEELSFEKFERSIGTERAYFACLDFNPTKENLYLWGPTGRGKTHLAYAVAQECINARKSVDIMTIRDFVNRFRMTKPEEEKEMVNDLVKKDVLIIDDIGRIQGTEFSIDILTNIIDKRSLIGKNGLIMTSNLFLNELSANNREDRLTSRIAGMCKVIEVRGEADYRLRRTRDRKDIDG